VAWIAYAEVVSVFKRRVANVPTAEPVTGTVAGIDPDNLPLRLVGWGRPDSRRRKKEDRLFREAWERTGQLLDERPVVGTNEGTESPPSQDMPTNQAAEPGDALAALVVEADSIRAEAESSRTGAFAKGKDILAEAESIRADSLAEAEHIRADAQAEAEHIRADAQAEAEHIRADALAETPRAEIARTRQEFAWREQRLRRETELLDQRKQEVLSQLASLAALAEQVASAFPGPGDPSDLEGEPGPTLPRPGMLPTVEEREQEPAEAPQT
jgi:hypothetical protein